MRMILHKDCNTRCAEFVPAGGRLAAALMFRKIYHFQGIWLQFYLQIARLSLDCKCWPRLSQVITALKLSNKCAYLILENKKK